MNKKSFFIKTTKILEDKKGMIISLLFLSFVTMLSVAYGALSKELTITGQGYFRVKEEIRITDLEFIGVTNNGLEDYESEFAKDTIKTGIDLQNNNSTVTYKVKVTNTGNVTMVLKTLENTEIYNNNNIKYTLNKTLPLKVSPLSDEYIEITFSWNSYNASNTRLDSMIKFNFEKAESILAGGNTGTTTFLNTSPINKTQVEKIEFMPTTEVPSEALGSWDASKNLDGSVMAWYVDDDSNNLYEVYIGGYGKINLSTGENLFRNFTNLVTLEFNDLVTTKDVTSMAYMFADCKKLTSIDVRSFNTSNVTNMSYMFNNCSSLTSLDIHTDGDIFNVSKVTDMSRMLFALSNLTELNMEGFNAPELTNITNLFGKRWDNMIGQIASGVKINMKNFNAPKITSVYQLFASNVSTKITEIDMSGIYLPSVTNMTEMFYLCSGLTKLDLTGATINSAQNASASMNSMFRDCKALLSLDVSGLYTSNVTNMTYMFSGCSSLTSLDVSGFDTKKVTNMSAMFSGCSSLTSLNVRSFNTSNVTNMSYMFNNCSSLTSLDIHTQGDIFNVSKVTDMSYMLYGLSKMTELNMEGFNALNLTNITYFFGRNYYAMLGRYSSGVSVNMKNFNAPKLTSLSYLFGTFNISMNIKEINLKGASFQNVTNMSYMFYNCTGLTSLDLSGINAPNVTNMTYMFSGCSSLTSLDVSDFNTTNVTNMSYMYDGCSKLTSLNLAEFNTTNVTNMSYMFNGCSKLTSLNVSNFNTSNVINMTYMFSGCSSLPSLDVSSFDTKKVTDMTRMFSGCSSLTSLNLNNFEGDSVTNMSQMVYGLVNVTSFEMRNFTAPNLTNISNLFGYTWNDGRIGENTSGTIIHMENFSAEKITSLAALFQNKKVKEVYLSGTYLPALTNISNMFNGCSLITTLDISGMDFTNVTNASNFGSNNVTSLTLDNIDNAMYDNTYFQDAVKTITTSTATVNVKDSDCATKLLGIKSTLNPVVIGA